MSFVAHSEFVISVALKLNFATAGILQLVEIVIKLFSFVSDLSLETLSSRVLEFEGKARANPIIGPLRCFLVG